jgi:hypothetical protein
MENKPAQVSRNKMVSYACNRIPLIEKYCKQDKRELRGSPKSPGARSAPPQIVYSELRLTALTNCYWNRFGELDHWTK